MLQYMLHHLLWNVHTGCRNAVAKFHCVIDFIDGQTIFRFKQIKRQQSIADGLCSASTQIRDLVGDGTICGYSSARGISDPVFRGAIDRTDGFITDHKSADVTPWLVDIFLNIKNLMIDSQRGFMLD